MDKKAMFRLSYGLFVLTTAHNGKDNGCIINTCMQATDNPMTVTITVNKNNYTADLIGYSDIFTVSILDESTPFDIFKRFGFASGRDNDKFAELEGVVRGDNGVLRLTHNISAYISAKVVSKVDLGSHYMFVAHVTDAECISDIPSVTYNYYQQNIKPKPQAADKPKGYTCNVCGYVYEGELLPPDYICPLCKHGADAFIKN